MEEVERYQSLSSDVDAQKTMWSNKRAAMVAAHGAYALQLRSDYERQLNTARERRAELSDELEGVKRDWAETRRQMDDDLDSEIEELKRVFQEKLDAERDATLKFKGENGIMRKKYAALSKEIDENKEEVRALNSSGGMPERAHPTSRPPSLRSSACSRSRRACARPSTASRRRSPSCAR
jgi:chromosome segregation ATPase